MHDEPSDEEVEEMREDLAYACSIAPFDPTRNMSEEAQEIEYAAKEALRLQREKVEEARLDGYSDGVTIGQKERDETIKNRDAAIARAEEAEKAFGHAESHVKKLHANFDKVEKERDEAIARLVGAQNDFETELAGAIARAEKVEASKRGMQQKCDHYATERDAAIARAEKAEKERDEALSVIHHQNRKLNTIVVTDAHSESDELSMRLDVALERLDDINVDNELHHRIFQDIHNAIHQDGQVVVDILAEQVRDVVSERNDLKTVIKGLRRALLDIHEKSGRLS